MLDIITRYICQSNRTRVEIELRLHLVAILEGEQMAAHARVVLSTIIFASSTLLQAL
jgi:hypothetical protein